MPTHPTQVHVPTKPIAPVSGGVSSQSSPDNRWLSTVFDQHKSARFPRGRPWWGYEEKQTSQRAAGGFVCELMPGDHEDPFGSTWSAPWYPTQVTSYLTNYLRLDMRKRTVTWLYAPIIADDKIAMQRYWEAAAKISYQNGWRVPEVNEPVSFQIQAILLEPPRDFRIAQACQAGDPWILGQRSENDTEEVNWELKNLLDGIRTVTDVRQPVVTPEQVLSKDVAIQEMVDKAVAAALAAIAEAGEQKKEAARARMANARASRRVKSPPAQPSAAA